MIYKVIAKSEFKRFTDALLRDNASFGPRQVDTDSRGKAIYQFLPVTSSDDVAFDYTATASSAKHFFMPFREELSRFVFRDQEWDQHWAEKMDSSPGISVPENRHWSMP